MRRAPCGIGWRSGGPVAGIFRYPKLPDARKIAVLRPSAVGDFVFALPALRALRAAYPDASIVYLGRSWHADFLAGRPGPVDKVCVMPPYPGITLAAGTGAADPEIAAAFVARLRREAFDLALQLHGGGSHSNPFVMSLGARLAVGLRSPEAAALDRWIRFGPMQNRRLQLLEAVVLAGGGGWQPGRDLTVTERDRREAAEVLPHENGRLLALIQPGATDPRRRWPANHFAAVGDRLADEGARVAVVGTAAESGLVRAVVELMKHPAIDLSGRLSLSGLVGLLERTALLVSNDTGPLHLALALGTPCVGIYWLTNLIESGPLLQDGHWPAVATRVHCSVCGEENLRTRCSHDESFVDDVAAESVAELASAALAQVRA